MFKNFQQNITNDAPQCTWSFLIEIQRLFKSPLKYQIQENKPEENKAAAKVDSKDEKKSPEEKPKEDVKAEREAKKAEKAARRAAALKAKEGEGGGGGGEQPPQQQQKKQTQPLKVGPTDSVD